MSQSAVYPSLQNKPVFITGGATGIGASLVRQFYGQGARVGFIDINDEAGQALAADIVQEGGAKPWFRSVNVCDVDALKNSVADFAAGHDGLGVLINNVANDTRHDPLEVTAESWRACLSVNLDSSFFAAQAAIPIMQRAGAGSIINFGSINALLGPTQMPGYVSAKAALLGLTKALARQYGPDGIRVNTLLPGWVVTERQLSKWLTEEAEQAWMEQVALKTRIMPQDIGNLALFLAADDSAMITNQQFIIDGGRV